MQVYEIPGDPIPLQRHRHSGKRTYDPQLKEKSNLRWKLRLLQETIEVAQKAIKLTIEYHLSIPKSYSKIKALKCVSQPHAFKPDLSNLIKFTEDAFNEILWKDDCLIAEISARKLYSEKPMTRFWIESLDD